MFETRPDFEQRVPSAIAMEGSRYWHAMVLSSNLPWYLLRHRSQTAESGFSITQTTAIAWDSTLRGVLETIDPDWVVDLCILAPLDESGDWTLRRVTEVWLATPQEKLDTGPLLFRLRGGASLLNTHLQPVSSSIVSRTLLIRLPECGPAGPLHGPGPSLRRQDPPI